MTPEDLKLMKRLARQRELDRAKVVGAPRAKSWGKKNRDAKEDRRAAKKNLKDWQ